MRKNKIKYFEELALRVTDFNPEYKLLEYLGDRKMVLTYLPTGEIFTRDLSSFFRGKSHAPSISDKIKQEKYEKTCLEKYGKLYASQCENVKKKIKKALEVNKTVNKFLYRGYP